MHAFTRVFVNADWKLMFIVRRNASRNKFVYTKCEYY